MTDTNDTAVFDEALVAAQHAEARIRAGRGVIAGWETVRKEAIDLLLDNGWSTRKLAAELGLSPARINQIRNSKRGVQ